jgi:NAD(P)-dependent dehydrogenase (short-subunit alcohol dehydrogenase family)
MSTIFIIGAGPKIGLQVPKLFASNGFTNIGLASRSKANLEALAAKLPSGTKVALADGTDASNMESIVRGLDTLQQSLGKPDVVVYNASSLSIGMKSLKDMTVADFEAHLRATLTGA